MKSTAYKSGAVVYEIPQFIDDRGALNVLEIARDLPFDCQRILYTYTVPEGSVRGAHAHKRCEQSSHSPDCILLVLASLPYENSDYIRDYGEFVAWKRTSACKR